MKLSDAAALLEISGTITPETVKQAFRLAAKKYHPDVNPAGADMMKMINNAFDTLRDFTGEISADDIASHAGGSYPAALDAVLNAIIALPGLNIEICGAWVWVHGDTYSHKGTLKELGFKWARAKKKWHFRPENWASTSRGNMSMDKIRERHGSTRPTSQGRNQIPASFA